MKKTFDKWVNKTAFLKINEFEYDKNQKYLKNYKGNLLVTLGEKGVRYNNTIIPPQRKAEVDACKKIMTCENCGRILVSNEF